MALASSTSPRDRDPLPHQEMGGRDRRPGLTPLSLFLVLLLAWVLVRIELVLILTLLALLLGTIIERPLQLLEQRRVPRPAGILLIYIAIIGGIVLLSWSIAPGIADQAERFNDQIPADLRELEEEWRESGNGLLSGAGAQFLDQVVDRLDQPATVDSDTAERAIPVLTNVTGFVISLLTLLVVTFYYTMEKTLLRRLILDQVNPESRPRVNRVWDNVEAKVGGWMRGQLLLCLIIGFIATVSYGIIDLPFWPLLGLWAGLTEIIPIVGPWIGGIPAVIIALTIDWQTGLIVAGVILAMQTLENWVLVPRVMRGAVGMSPLAVFVAILAGTQLMGVVGAVLAIPIAASVQVIVTDYFDVRRGKRSAADQASGWRWMLLRSGREHDDADTAAAQRAGPSSPPGQPGQAQQVNLAARSTSPAATNAAPPPATERAERSERNGASHTARPASAAAAPAKATAGRRTAGPATAGNIASRLRPTDGWSRTALERISRPRAPQPEPAPSDPVEPSDEGEPQPR